MISDRRGSILLPGMAMGVILTLGGMHVIDTTKAILYRALGQNAVDAVTLESAVWHAQGMNLIVLINVVMAAIFSILVAIRVAELLLIGAIAILAIAAAVASFFSFGSAGSAATTMMRQLTQALVRVQRFEDRVSNPILNTLTKAANAERTVAAVMPYIALAHPVTLSFERVEIPFSFSLVPSEFERWASKAPNAPPWKGPKGEDPGPKVAGFEVESSFPARMGTVVLPSAMDKMVKNATNKLGKLGKAQVNGALTIAKWSAGSLPVQEEDFYQVCGRAGELMSATLLQVLGGPAGLGQDAIDKVSSFVAVIVGSLPTLMCTPLKQVKDSVMGDVDDAIAGKCKEEKSKAEDAGEDWDDARQKKCTEDHKKKMGKLPPDPVDSETIKVARLWGIISNPKESPFLHVYGFSYFPSKLKLEPADANAEFRHVCDERKDAAYRGCGENSMWSNGWFAKMVPVRPFIVEVRQKIGEIFAGWFSRVMGKSITGLVDRVLKHVSKTPAATNALGNALNRMFGTLAGPKAANGWWNRRLASSEPMTWLSNWEVNDLQRFPEYLH